jgi:preprotein translocase subunit SecE
VSAFLQELVSFRLYKRNQGRVARQATFAALAVIIALGGWSLSAYWSGYSDPWRYGVPLVLVAFGIWASFRIVQMPAFADFLIAVEGEMNKVSWPSRSELFRAAMVVILVIFFLAAILFGYDVLLAEVMRGISRVVDWVFGPS